MKYPVKFELSFRTHNYPGKLIALEGIDGSGKTTQAQKVVEELRAGDVDAVYTKEPTDGEIGRFIREILIGKKKFESFAFQYLFAADRVEHQTEVMDLLSEGKIVVSDRWFWSSVAYGLLDRGIDIQKNNEQEVLLVALSILSMYHRFIAPDITFYLDIPVKLVLERLSASRHIGDIYDKYEKLEKVKQGYEWLSEKFAGEFVIIDATKNVEKVSGEIINKL